MIYKLFFKRTRDIGSIILFLTMGFLYGCATQMSSSEAIPTKKPVNNTPEKIKNAPNHQNRIYKVQKVYFLPAKSTSDINKLTNIFESNYHQISNSVQSIPDTLFPESIIANSGDTIIDLDYSSPPIAEGTHDLWDRIRLGFSLEHQHSGVKGDLNWYSSNQDYLDRVADRATPYLYMIVTEIERRGIPTEIALLPIVESAFQPFAYSHGRAAGIWQFIPDTGRHYGLKQTWWYDGRRDVYASTQAALDYLEKLHNDFDGDWLLALAAYNSGEGTVSRAITKNKLKGKPTDFWSLDLPRETQGYVPKLLAISTIVADPQAYGISLKSIPDGTYLTKVEIDGQIDLSLAADLANISLEDLYRFNPGFNRWATDPNGPNYLLLPVDATKHFTERLASLPSDKRVHWKRHRVKRGETLVEIAQQFKTTIEVLKQANNLRGSIIHTGRNLVIPVAVNNLNSYTLSADQRRKDIQNTPRNGRKVVHTVTAGETFWELSRRHNVSVRQLAAWNSMAPGDPLKSGQTIVIWSKKSNEAVINPISRAAPPRDQITRRIHYIVRKGDSLAAIAERFRVTISQLRQWNSLRKGIFLQPGQRLKLFVDVTRQSG